MLCSITLILIEFGFLMVVKEKFFSIMTNLKEEIEIAKPLLVLFALNVLFEGIRGFIRGLIRALEL